MYVCMCAFVYVCGMYAYVYVSMYQGMYVCIHKCM
jgi:hypothetical protein